MLGTQCARREELDFETGLMIPRGVRIFVRTEPQDMRRSFDGLSLAVREVLGDDPQNGALFVFVNKRSNRLKSLL